MWKIQVVIEMKCKISHMRNLVFIQISSLIACIMYNVACMGCCKHRHHKIIATVITLKAPTVDNCAPNLYNLALF